MTEQPGRIPGLTGRLALEGAGVGHEMVTYSGAPHAFTVFGSPRYREDADSGWAEFAKAGEGPILGVVRELIALRKDGSEFPIELSR